jgi:hypothetical protein
MAKVGDIFQVFINTVTSETIAGHQCIAANTVGVSRRRTRRICRKITENTGVPHECLH